MSSIDATGSIERQRFFNGQRLFASDLQGIEAFNREMGRMHNESLHQPGIGNGFAVSGRKGDREVVVGSGYAIDDLGREIVLTSSRTIAVPPVAGDVAGKPKRYVLTVQYPDDADLEEVELREGICDTRGAVRLREEPIFCWVALNPDGSPAQDQAQILSGRNLVLAEIAVRECKLDKDLSIAQRRNARPPSQPHIACGVAQPTPWKPWNPWDEVGKLPGGVNLALSLRSLYQLIGGLQADIDTATGGFLTTPGYFARIDGPRFLTTTVDGVAEQVVLDGLLSVVNPTATGFTVQVLVLVFDWGPVGSPPEGLVRAARSDPPPVVEGFDVSALAHATVIGSDESGGDATAAETGTQPATGEQPDLVELLKEWQVGWMGVEG